LGTESDSEYSDDSSKDEDYESSSKRMKHVKKTLDQFPFCQNVIKKKPRKSAKGNCVNEQSLKTDAGMF
jgi:hypothetical protein